MITDGAMKHALVHRIDAVSRAVGALAEALGHNERPDLRNTVEHLCTDLQRFASELETMAIVDPEQTVHPTLDRSSVERNETQQVSGRALLERVADAIDDLAEAYDMALRAQISLRFGAIVEQQLRKIVVIQRRVDHLHSVTRS